MTKAPVGAFCSVLILAAAVIAIEMMRVMMVIIVKHRRRRGIMVFVTFEVVNTFGFIIWHIFCYLFVILFLEALFAMAFGVGFHFFAVAAHLPHPLVRSVTGYDESDYAVWYNRLLHKKISRDPWATLLWAGLLAGLFSPTRGLRTGLEDHQRLPAR